MQMKTYFLSLVTLLVLGGCAKKTDALVTINVNHPDQTVEMKVSDLISDPEYIPLETNDSCLIRNGATFYATDDYIVSIARRQIYLFDRRTGRFVREIGKAGEGPNDYLMVTRVLPVDNERKTIAAGGAKGLLRYDFEGRLVDRVPTVPDKFMPDMVEVAPDLFAGYLFNSPEKLLLFNRQGKVIRSFPNYNVSEAMAMTVPYHSYYRYLDHTNLCEWFNDTIFTVHPEALTPRYVLARGSYQLSMERLAQGENQVLHFPLCTYETDRYLWHEYSLDQKPYLLLYDKRSGKSLLNHEGALITEDLRQQGKLRLSTIEGQQFVGYISAEEATTLNEEDNPIIVIGKVK